MKKALMVGKGGSLQNYSFFSYHKIFYYLPERYAPGQKYAPDENISAPPIKGIPPYEKNPGAPVS